MPPTIAPLPDLPMTGWDILGIGLGIAGSVLAVGLVLLALAALWFALIGMRETVPRGSRTL